MKYRTLGSTGMRVSVVGVGTWQFGGEWGRDFTEADAAAILGAARDVGINLIDTAECYGDHLSEELVGQAIEGSRDQWVVATKFGHTFHGHMDRTRHWSPAEVQKQLEDSLKALRTDYVDLYQFHSGSDGEFDTEGLWEMLNKQVKAGKIRHLGISIGWNKNTHQVAAAPRIHAGAIQVVYNRLDQGPEDEVFPLCREHNLGVLVRVPLASGYLSGKYKPGVVFSSNDVRAGHDPEMVKGRLERVEQIRTEELPEDVEMAQYALAWCLKHPAVTCVIPGCKNPGQVQSNASAADLDIVSESHPQSCE